MASRLVICSASSQDSSKLVSWMRNARPHQVLGLPESKDFSLKDVKEAFRSKVKEYHPDVYKGPEDAEAITQCLIQAYEQLTSELKPKLVRRRRRSDDPFDDPEGPAEDLFVNQFLCIGRSCPYSCVARAPNVFRYDSETGCAQASVQGRSDDYTVQLAVGQCPRNCIHYVTNDQRKVLEDLLQSAIDDPYSDQYSLLENLIVQARSVNRK